MWGIGALLESQYIPIPPLFSASIGLILSAIIGIYICGRRQRQQKKFIGDAFSRYVPLAVQCRDKPHDEAVEGIAARLQEAGDRQSG